MKDVFTAFGDKQHPRTMTFQQFVAMIRVTTQWRDGGELPSLEAGLYRALAVRNAKGGYHDAAFKRGAQIAFAERISLRQLTAAAEAISGIARPWEASARRAPSSCLLRECVLHALELRGTAGWQSPRSIAVAM